jgi:hypothetical protein
VGADVVVVEVGPVVVEFVVVGPVVVGLVIGLAVFAFELLDFEALLLLSALLFETELLLDLRLALLTRLFDLFPFLTLEMWWLRNLPFTAICDKATDEKSNNGDTTRIVTLKIRGVALGFIAVKTGVVRNVMMTI